MVDDLNVNGYKLYQEREEERDSRIRISIGNLSISVLTEWHKEWQKKNMEVFSLDRRAGILAILLVSQWFHAPPPPLL